MTYAQYSYQMKQFIAALTLIAILFAPGCVDDDFGLPPIDGEIPDIEVTTTIAELKAMHTLGQLEAIEEDLIISGVVISDDRQGNFFRQLIIQDSTGGIEIRMNETDLYNEYGRGRRIYVRCNGLWLGDFAGVTQIGAAPAPNDDGELELSRIPAALFDSYIVKGQWNQDVTPKVVKAGELTSADISTLITLENAQFVSSSGQTYAVDSIDGATGERIQESANRDLFLCDEFGASMLVRSSGFSAFASTPLPTGSGTITGVYGVFNQDRQLLIRDTDDVDMTNPNCSAGNGMDIVTIRALYTGSDMTIDLDATIRATVISDHVGMNVNGNNLVVQDESGGIVIRFNERHSIPVGTVIEFNPDGLSLTEFNNVLQIENVPMNRVVNTGDISPVTPRVATTSQINANGEAWESTLVRIVGARISGSATYAGSTTITDAEGNLDMFTLNSATFSSLPLPAAMVDLTAIVSEFRGDRQVNLRNEDDIVEEMIVNPDPVDISAVRGLYTGSGMNIDQNWSITGVVISDRSANNINGQNIVLQDGSAGIVVRFSTDHGFNLGDQLTIGLLGTEIGDFNGLVQVSQVPLSFVLNNTTGTLPAPRMATVADLLANGDNWESTLVQVQNISVDDGSELFSGDVSVTDGTGMITLRTESDAAFAANPLPIGAANLTAIVDDFNGTQLRMRNIDDIDGDFPAVDTNLLFLRSLHAGGTTSVPFSKTITATVISDASANNIHEQNIVIQDDVGGGIVMRFTDAHSLPIGTRISFDVENLELSEFSDLLQINNVPLDRVTNLGIGTLPTPRVATVADILANGETWESTLVAINGAMISGSSTYSGTVMVADATGDIAMFTRSQATFAGESIPTGSVNLTAIVSEFDGTRQVNIRNLGDVQ